MITGWQYGGFFQEGIGSDVIDCFLQLQWLSWR